MLKTHGAIFVYSHRIVNIMNEFDRCMMQGFENLLYGDGITFRSNAGQEMEIVTLNRSGTRYTRRAHVIWSVEALKQIPLMSTDGGIYYEGDVLMTIKKKDLNSTPRPGNIIEVPSGTAWRIVDVIYDYETYALKLVRNT